MKRSREYTVSLEKLIPGGQAIGTLDDGKKALVWGGLPGETVKIVTTKSKKSFVEGCVTEVLKASADRVAPRDPDSFLSTSPWQILDYKCELSEKSKLIKEAFLQEKIELDQDIPVITDDREYEYRNKMEYSFWWDSEQDKVSLAFFKRGGRGKVAIDKCSLAKSEITEFSKKVVEVLGKLRVEARELKTLLVRSDSNGTVAGQLYVKDVGFFDKYKELPQLVEGMTDGYGMDIIYSNPISPASVATEVLYRNERTSLRDKILDTDYTYATDGFFQINVPVYEMALLEIKRYIETDKVVDMYSGVGTIGLSVARDKELTLVEVNDSAIAEMKKNVKVTKSSAKVVHAESEKSLEYIYGEATTIVDPPRAGLHKDLVNKMLEKIPERVVYLSCNPTTQARDVKLLEDKYEIRLVKGFNFFPRTPHIECLVVLDKKR